MNELEALVQLARRTNPKLIWWCSGEWRKTTPLSYYITCHICNQEIVEDTEDAVYLHGIQHLKDFNLLPFL